MPDLEATVGVAIAVLAAALVVGVVAERTRVPYVVALLLVATPFEIPHLRDHFATTLLFVFLPALVFEAAWNVDARELRRHAAIVALLAIPGVMLTAALVGVGLALAGQLPLVPALLLGTILAATDPIAVIAVFRRSNVPAALATIVEGESLFNDGTAIVLYGIAVSILSGNGATPPIWSVAWQIVWVSIGGALVGLVVAALVARLLRDSDDAPLQVVGTLVAAYGSYLLADRLGLSGIFACVVVGIAMRAFPRFPSKRAAADADGFWAALAFLANAFVFVLMGLRIEFSRIVHEPTLVLLTLALVTLARIVLAFVALPRAAPSIDRGGRVVLALSGMRGAVSVALALSLPADIASRPAIVDAVFGVVFLTLVGQGLAIGPTLARLKPA